jgi:hypothetical protein
MRALLIAAALMVSGCSAMKPAPTDIAPGASPARAPATPSSPTAPSPPVTPPSTPAVPPPPSPPPPEVPPSPASPALTPPPAPAVRASPPPKSAAAHPVKPEGAAPVRAVPSLAPVAAASSPAAARPAAGAPTLNLADLEQRLRDTRAIGVFTKLSLKNQVDDLLKAFRDLYRNANQRPPAELRQRYDGLLLKVLTLLQDGDPPLAAAIASSREAIWNILADPEQFAKI